MRHPADSMAWKSFDELHPSFAVDPRNVRLGLASDGFQPFRNSKTSHSIWPVVLIPYNLPPWLCMKQENFILSMLIPGPNGPGDAIDTYLQPLIEELKELWDVGIETYDASTRKNFKLHASLLWTINDFPAYGNLSGWSTKGKLACPCCNKNTASIRLTNCKKQCFIGHRRYLPLSHKWRNETKSFDGTQEKSPPPKMRSGIEILNQVQDLEGLQLSKDPKKRKKISHENRNDNWNKKSIFFQLPYWKCLLLRHNLDVMHIEKKKCDNIMGTIINVKGKTQDTIKTRLDLQEMNIRSELHPIQNGEKFEVPTACYTLSPEDKHKLCLFLKNLKVPDGVLGSKELKIDNLEHIEAQIPITLCKLEKLFPPSFFDVMEHLPVHLASEAKIAGPIHYRWMYYVERWLYFLKSLIGNRACPEGSIAEGYIAIECMTLCSRFKMKPIKTESEDSSTTKSTMRYTFVAPGAIGKGRGRGQGLKSLGEKGSMPTKKLFSQSNDLVNHYIQEIETKPNLLWKTRGQGPKISTMSASLGMETMHKNALTLEKENMKSSIPSPACTNQVKQYTQEVKTSPGVIGKGLEKRSEVEMSSQGTRSNSTMSSNQEMRTMDKNPLICEEAMQINISLPPSVDQVMKHSETTETTEKGSSNPKKVKRVRGSNMYKEVATLEIGQKLTVTFYNNRTVGTNSKLFSRHLGKIVRDRNICPLGVSSWNDIKQEKLNHMWAAVEHKFEAVDMNDHRDHILGWMNELWNKWRGHLHAKYVKDKPIHQSLRTIPRGVEKKNGNDYSMSPSVSRADHLLLILGTVCHEARGSRNAANRAKLKMLHHIGSKPIREIIYQKGGKNGNPPDLATIFFETRKKDNKFVEPEAIEKHAQLKEMVQADSSLPSIEIVEKCCGPQTRSHVFGFGGGVKAKDLKGGTSSKAELFSALRSTQEDNKCLNEENKSLNEKNKSLNHRLSTLEDAMKQIMKMKELFAAQQSNVQPTTSPISTE
ncbi:hypothetical protein MTR67_031842 [Solanum verrucosum]|uniref:DUF4218 domain-containing protein n=1 Tax=Solanum verrucosum TaxID=315347 RepID=A0AAF0U3B4_SOLVR|nr:hypothetical protein MTR67_031842 [Solanum verrucosum]